MLKDHPGRQRDQSTNGNDGKIKARREASEQKTHDTAYLAQDIQKLVASMDTLCRKRRRFTASWSGISEGVETVYQLQLSTIRPTDKLFAQPRLKALATQLAKADQNARFLRLWMKSALPRTVSIQLLSRLKTLQAVQGSKKALSSPSFEQKQPSEDPHDVKSDSQSSDESNTPASSVDVAPLPEFPVPKYCIHEPEKLPPGAHFSHKLYRDPDGEPVKVHYTTDYATAEKIAQQFLDEPVLGFDLEWETRPPKSFKESVSLVQLASPSRIALFHLAKFNGTTPSSILPPTLIEILESPAILKCGVSVKGDATRLETHLGLHPLGCFELSRTHNLLSPTRNLDGSVPRSLFALHAMCERYLGLPLLKDHWVRAGRWSWRLDENQKHYAAADAYAGLVLFHELERRRLGWSPVSPRPECVDCEGPIVEVKKVEVGNGEEEEDWVDVDDETDDAATVGLPKSVSKLAIKVRITRRRLKEDPGAKLDPGDRN